ncbi:hypothetical protein [Polaromonas sp. A23]|uniref:hypothetical protein n=1 Tax=Polaromonas sp. A23 TaxID=1944133 RepID=UPI00143AA8BE|nr:hypothetical protein [Polaromonas sp. A23]
MDATKKSKSVGFGLRKKFLKRFILKSFSRREARFSGCLKVHALALSTAINHQPQSTATDYFEHDDFTAAFNE